MSDLSHLGGWVNDPQGVEEVMKTLPHPVFSSVRDQIKGSGRGQKMFLYDIIRKVAGHFPDRIQTVGDCFVSGTMVCGEKIKPIEEVQVGDRVLSGEGKFTSVISTRCIQSSKPLIEITPLGGLPITCTEDHRFLVYRLGKYAGKNITRKYYERTLGRISSESTNNQLVATYENRKPEWITAGELEKGDLLLTPTDIEIESNIPEVPFSMYTLGVFLGDGHASGRTMEITFSDVEISNIVVSDLIDSGFNPKLDGRTEEKHWRIRVHDTKLVEWLRNEFYDEDKVKRFPCWAIGDEEFLSGLYEADGFQSGDKKSISSTSLSIVYSSYLTLVKMGYCPSIANIVRTKGCYNNAKPLYNVSWQENRGKEYIWSDEKYVCRPVYKLEKIEGSTLVYDIGVEDEHHSFLANGISVHNCVSQGAAYAVDAVKCVDIYIRKEFERWVDETATEDIYWGSRNIIGGGRLGNGDGSLGVWAARYVNEYGAIPRGKYGSIDLREYSGSKARSWGRRGHSLPRDFVNIIKEHPIQVISQVTTYEEVCDLIYNGYAVTIASNQGFSSRRDSEGFARPQGSWAHQMSILGFDDEYRRPGVLVQNSWGVWNGGPKRHNQPDGSFWVDADEIERRILRTGDCWAFSGYSGFKPQKLNTRII